MYETNYTTALYSCEESLGMFPRSTMMMLRLWSRDSGFVQRWEFVEYFDCDETGETTEEGLPMRTAAQTLVEDIEDGSIERVIIYDLSVLVNTQELLFRLLEACAEQKVPIFVMNYDGSGSCEGD